MTDWVYQAIVTKVYDGDTITVDLDMGLRVWQKDIDVRLYGINAPELRGNSRIAGQESRDALRLMVPLGSNVTIMSHKYEKYGRLLATVLNTDKVNVNEWMIANRYAVAYLVD